jgi:hypothetical protein
MDDLEPHECGSKAGDPDWCWECGEHRSHPAHKPQAIPADVWEIARELRQRVTWESNTSVEAIARVIVAARKVGAEQEWERITAALSGGWVWMPYPSEGDQPLFDVLVVGKVQRFYDDAPTYGEALGQRIGAIATDEAAREAVKRRILEER